MKSRSVSLLTICLLATALLGNRVLAEDFSCGSLSPVYPARALSREPSGRVLVEFTIDGYGKPQDLVAIESTSSLFDRAAIGAVKKISCLVPKDITGSENRLILRTIVTFDLNGESVAGGVATTDKITLDDTHHSNDANRETSGITSELDVSGIRLGMTLDGALLVLKSKANSNIREVSGLCVEEMLNNHRTASPLDDKEPHEGSCIAGVGVGLGDGKSLDVHFWEVYSSSPRTYVVSGVRYRQAAVASNTAGSIRADVEAKYGKPNSSDKEMSTGTITSLWKYQSALGPAELEFTPPSRQRPEFKLYLSVDSAVEDKRHEEIQALIEKNVIKKELNHDF
jgi:TonB family protein